MIDIESEVYTKIASMVREKFPKASFSSEYVNAPGCFPHVHIEQTDNFVTSTHLDSSDTERFVSLTFDVNVYSGKSSGRKSECKSIMSIIDDAMYSLNFTRISLAPVPNRDDPTIYRLTGRYTAETDGTRIYRR